MNRVADRRGRRSLRIDARAAVEALPHLGWLTAPSGLALYFNQSTVALTGRSNAELNGAGWAAVIHPDDLDDLRERWYQAVTTSQPLEATYRIRDLHGDYHLVAGHASSLDPSRPDATWMGMATVVSDPMVARTSQRETDVPSTWDDQVRAAATDDSLICLSQSIVSLAGGHAREELLVRLRSSDGKEVLPTAFVPAIESSGVIADLDRWMLQRGIDRALAGHLVHVNISARTVEDPDLLTFLPRVLAARQVPAGNLTFELTETWPVRDRATVRAFAELVADLGCGLALDDFGSGFAAFRWLAELPTTYMKIDREFVVDLRTNSAHSHVVDCVVRLAEQFGCETIAEGVEDEATLDLLRARGIDYAQGFYFGRPEPVA